MKWDSGQLVSFSQCQNNFFLSEDSIDLYQLEISSPLCFYSLLDPVDRFSFPCKTKSYGQFEIFNDSKYLTKHMYSPPFLSKFPLRASLVAQWLGIRLPMQGTRVRAPVREDPTCRGAARPVSHNYWACASEACAPRQWEARAPRWRVAPPRRNWREPLHRNEDPMQPKLKEKKKIPTEIKFTSINRIMLNP